jgi:PAS domain S-box-containing protein
MKTTDIGKILVVDDEESMCNLLISFLAMSGYYCKSTTDSAQALAMLEHDDFDLVISDIRMEGMDGLDLVREICRKYPTIDTIIMSGFTGDYTYSDVIEAGAVDFIAKPISLPELKAKITRVNREHKTLAEVRDAHEAIKHSLAVMEIANEKLSSEIAEREKAEKELYRANRDIESLIASIPLIMIEVAADGIIKRWNAEAERVFRVKAPEAIGIEILKCPIPWERQKVNETLCTCSLKCAAMRLKALRFTRADGKEGLLDLTISPITESAVIFSGHIILGADITEHELLERQLAQAQKLESIGQLAAGIAHEINTPTQYVGDNTRFLDEVFGGLERIHVLYDQLLDRVRSGGPTHDLLEKIEAAASEVNLDYIRAEIPKAIKESIEGIARISHIVRAMKEFSHPGSGEKTSIDLNRAIENTIMVARNEWKYVAEIETSLDPDLPLVPCLPGEVNQVILNMIINAAHAIAEKQKRDGSEQKGTIKISTRKRGECAEISINDTGTGIAEAIKSKIFDPFFTTKEVGKGTGQGLAISHSVIVEKLGGSIDFETRLGEGTTFVVRLPI